VLISTNGYLLTLPAALALFDAGIQFFHVTLDGPASCHDRLRVLTDGGATFSAIVHNLHDLLTHIPGAHVTLRVNVDETTVKFAGELLEQVSKAFRSRIQVNVASILKEERRPTIDLYRQINRVARDALNMGYWYMDTQLSLNRLVFCPADKWNSFHVGPDGSLHKCSPRDDKPEVDVGHIDAQGLRHLKDTYRAWHGFPQFRRECLACQFLCFCMGGCRLERMRGIVDVSCREKYADIENMIINRYIALSNRQLADG
jgi:uncharacterized protein